MDHTNQIDSVLDKTNFFSIDSEKSVLGTILYSPNLLEDIYLEPEDFFLVRHAWIFDVCRSLHTSGMAVDLLSVTETLQRRNQLDEIGGLAYLMSLVSDTYSTLAAENHSKIIKDYAQRRNVIQIANSMANSAMDLSKQLDVEIFADKIRASHRSPFATVSMGDALDRAMSRIELAIDDPKDIWGIKTGFLDYNYHLGGMHKSEMVMLSGEPGVGKSRWALQMAIDMADPNLGNTPGVIYSMEMSIEALAMRAISGESKVGSRQMRTGRINDEMYSQIKATVNRIRKYPIRMSTAKINPTELRASLNHLTREYGIGWFVIDYLGLMSGFERETERFERIGALATSVKQIINDFDIAGLVLSSVNKTGMQTGQAAMTDMSGSGSVPHDADVILKLIKPADQPDVISLKILKTRDNDLGAGTINFRNAPNTMWFGNLKKVELNVDNHSPKTMF